MANHGSSLFELARMAHPDLPEQLVIRGLCEALLCDAEAEPPVPVERIASLRGIARIDERDQPYAGLLTPRGNNFAVSVRTSDSYERQRFTVCHETGHTLFAGFSQRQFRCGGKKNPLEQRCDLAATEMLLPYRFFVDDLAAGEFGLATVETLANHYEASIEATALRAVDLGPEPALFMVFRLCHKPRERGREHDCEPKLRLAYAYARGDWPYLRRHKSVTNESAFARAYNGEVVAEVGELEDLTATAAGRVEIHARRYGRDGRVLALARRPRSKLSGRR